MTHHDTRWGFIASDPNLDHLMPHWYAWMCLGGRGVIAIRMKRDRSRNRFVQLGARRERELAIMTQGSHFILSCGVARVHLCASACPVQLGASRDKESYRYTGQ